MNIRLNGKRYTDLNMLTGNIDPEVIAFLQEWYNEKEEVIGHTSGSTGKPKEIRLLKKDKIGTGSSFDRYQKYRRNQCLPSDKS